jgi:S1-C subfamily serine protease
VLSRALFAVLATGVISASECARADFLDALVYITTSLEYADGRIQRSGEGTGFVINKQGFVVTAKHLVPKEVPEGATLILRGSLRSRDNPSFKLISAEVVPLGVDITLLRFDPASRPSWEYLKISPKKLSDIQLGETVVAWGFALNQSLNRGETKVQSILGPENTIQVGGGIFAGMSGGPVTDLSNDVIGVVTGGARGLATMNFYTPISLADPLIHQFAEYAGTGLAPSGGAAAPVNNPIAKNYEIVESRHIGALSSKAYSVTREAESGREITAAKFVATTVSGVSDISVAVSQDRKSVTLRYVVNGGADGTGTLLGNIFTEQR